MCKRQGFFFPGFPSLNASTHVLLFSGGAEQCLEFVFPYIKKMQRTAAEIRGTTSVSLYWKDSESSSSRIFCIGQYFEDYGIWKGGVAIIAVHSK